jgi:hypothetical protein
MVTTTKMANTWRERGIEEERRKKERRLSEEKAFRKKNGIFIFNNKQLKSANKNLFIMTSD